MACCIEIQADTDMSDMALKAVDQDLTVEVITVENEQCSAKIKHSGGPVQVGARLEAVR